MRDLRSAEVLGEDEVVSIDQVIGMVVGACEASQRRGAFTASPQMLMTLRRMQDCNGQALIEPRRQIGEPYRMLGYPVLERRDAVGLSFGVDWRGHRDERPAEPT